MSDQANVPGQHQIPVELRDHTDQLRVWLAKLLYIQLQTMGLFEGRYSTTDELLTANGLNKQFKRWMEESLAILTREQYVLLEGEHWVTAQTSLNTINMWQEWEEKKQIWLQSSGIRPQVILAETALRALPDILAGRQLATNVLFPDSSMDLVEGIYKNNPIADYFNEVLGGQLAAIVDEKLKQNAFARIRIIEFGAGTGGTSKAALEKLKPYAHIIDEYCYTDISKAFLLHAEQKYGPEYPFLTYKTVDVSKPLRQQTVNEAEYDVVIAANVLHATANIRQTLRNIKAALKKNGRLLLNEITDNTLFAHLTFGLLEGWWLYEDSALRIPGCPGLFPKTWKKVLGSEGFRKISFPVQEAVEWGQQIIISESDGVIVQRADQARTENQFRTEPVLSEHQKNVSLDYPKKQTSSRNAILNMQNNLIAEDFTDQMIRDHVRTIIRDSIETSLKMKQSQIDDDQSFAEYGVDSIIAVNLINLINNQTGIVMQTTVLFDYNNVNSLTRHMINEYRAAIVSRIKVDASPALPPLEYMQEPLNKTIRAEATASSGSRNSETAEAAAEEISVTSIQTDHESEFMYYKVVLEKPGDIEDIKLVQDQTRCVQDHEVQIAVRAFSLNFGDLLCVRGLYPTMPPYPFTPGFEASGVIVKVGKSVKDLRRGDEVIAMMGDQLGGHASMIICPAAHVVKKPRGLTFEEACSLPAVAITILDVFQKAKPQQGERILIQTAAGGTGLLAVQLAQHYGLEIYATAGSEAKLAYLKQLGVPHGINYLEQDFEAEIRRLTKGKGVDIVINTLSGDAIQKGLACLSPGGRYVEIAMTALKSAKNIDLSMLSNNQTFYSIDLRRLAFDNHEVIRAYLDDMAVLIEQDVIRPTIFTSYSLEQIREAYYSIQNRNNIGKIIVYIPERYLYQEPAINTPESTNHLLAYNVHETPTAKEEIAIIGISGRFAKSQNPEQLWQHLLQGDDLIGEVTRWDLDKFHTKDKSYCKHGSFIEDMDRFDPLFFNISGVEATYMDPQQRIFLEESWKALEDAGYAGTRVQGLQCGVYVGCSGMDYQSIFGNQAPPQAFWGNANSVVPARIAYYLNLQGPAITVDTACSSSLVAIHLACQSLWAKETDMGLAGGVFVQSTPGFYVASDRAGMLSPTGRCHTFDERADGFVPGEGAGVVVLKRLREAIADNDQIYGVIRGSGINQDGTTNGITAPSAKSQERLEQRVYDTFAINPEHIQLVEAHGTGTKLGDPIEFHALTKAFRKYTDKKQFCAIGSVKTNIGHTATAAGVAGLLKILLSMRHKAFAPSLHFKQRNAQIQLKESPFYVPTISMEWDVDTDRRRCAAISSFGFSGTNAHMVIEEAPELPHSSVEKPGYLIVLSARTADQLRLQVQQLVNYGEQMPHVHCGNMSYTLLMGRKHMEFRLACIARSLNEMATLLTRWLAKGSSPQVTVSHGNINLSRERSSLIRYGNECLQKCQHAINASEYLDYLGTAADLYIQGYELDFGLLFPNNGYRTISLPTYPFARERYWVPMAEASEAGDRAGSRAALLHPLLHRNLSDLLNGQRYGTTFTGEEEFLADHVVQGRKLLPGVVYLEMARAAVEQAAAWMTDKHSLLLRHVVWSRPLSVGEEPAEVQIALYPEEDGTISYDIYGQTAACGDEVYSQGNVALGSEAGKEASLDLTALRSRCSRGRVTAETCYALFQTMGLAYGPSHQAIEELYRGEGEALAKLKLPESLFDKQAECMLHPGMVDAALQASIALLAEEHLIAWDRNASDVKSREAAALPFALEEAEVLRPCASSMWAVVQYRAGRGAPEKVRKLDIALCDEAGHVCVWLRGVTSRSPEAREGLLLLEPVWEEVSERASGSEPPVYREHRVLFCESATEWTGELSARWSKAHCVRLGAAGGIAERFEVYALAVFEEIRERMKVPGEGLTLLQVVIPGSGESELVAGLTGLLRTARLENSRLVGQLIEVEAGTAADTVAEQLQAGAGYLEETHLRIAGGQLQRAGWQEYEADARGEEAAVAEQEAGAERLNRQAGQGLRHPWKAGGVYVITGGGGGLGRIFAEEIAQRAQGATLILTGRSAELPESTWRELEQLPAQVLYEPVDVTDAGAVEELMMRIRQTYGRVNGILHSAGVTRDSLIRNKTADEWREVLAPKVAGTVNLDEACREDELDLLILFSSGAGATGNIGQADYAAANAFMDRYAQRRNEQVKAGERRGRTLSVSWPLWEAGGMQVSEEQRDRLLGQTGLRPLRTETGIAALYRGLASSSSQVLVAEGNLPKLRRRLLSVSAMAAGADAWAREAHGMTAEANAQYAPALFAEEQRQEKDTLEARSFSEQAPSSFQGQASGLEAVIVRQVAELLQVEECAINPEADWSEYGLDPVQLAEVAHRLRDRQGWELSPAWLLEQPNVCEAAKYAAEQIRRIKKPDIRLLHNAEGVSMEAALTEAGLEEQAVQYVKQRLAGVIGLPESRIEADAPMEQYGIDSILIMQMTDELETDFGSLPKTLFFEYQTIRALSGYFIEAHSERLRSLLKEGKPGAASAVAQARAVAGKSGAKAAVQKRQPAVSEEPPFAARARAAAASGRRGSPWDTDLPLLGRPAFRRERLRVESHSPLAGGVVREAEQEIAIIGMAGRYPGARNVEQFWQNLRSGKDSITEIPTSRWDHRRYYDAAPGTAGKTYGQWGGFLDGVDEFDPLFFNVSPREAEMMDPQERLFMQCVYETLEDAGYTRESLSPQAVGVYVGVMYEEYQLYGAQSSIALSGNPSSIANRVSYFCNFRGPSMAVDTMCSSSLTAIHLACQSLRQQECGVAVAGGVNVSVHPNKYVMLAQGRFLSSKGRCESFGRGGDGYVPGEGVGAVLLKPLSRAVADGDRIYGVIKGSALNHGGKTNGYTVPNPKAQAEVIEQALKEAGIDARTISYVEAHGTGTSLGDPIEVAGLSKAFGGPAEKPYCAIGSAKSNIGHGESAAGIAGVTKVLLQMQHGELAPSLHAKETNPHIDFSRSPFTVQQELGPWERPVMEGEHLPRRAGISSFGAGGANAHVIIEEYRETRPNQQAAETPERPVMIVLSAKSAERLKAQAEQLLEALQSGVYGGCTLADVGYTLQVGREALEERLGLLAESLEELASKLQAYVEGADEGKATAGEGFFYRGQAKGGREALSVFAGEEEMQEMVSRWLQRGKYEKVLEVWTRGLAVNWLEQYGETEKHRPRRISLPTYPFVRDRYWAPMKSNASWHSPSAKESTVLHPLLHWNTSDLNELRYSSMISAEDPFLVTLRDHNSKMLPDVFYLEMAYAAAQLAIPEGKKNVPVCIQLRDVTWLSSAKTGDKPLELHIGLYSEVTDAVSYEIYGGKAGSNEEIYSYGRAIRDGIEEFERETLDLSKLMERFSHELDKKVYNDAFKTMNMDNSGFLSEIERVYMGENEILMKFLQPSSLPEQYTAFELPMESVVAALQTGIGWINGGFSIAEEKIETLRTVKPVALELLEVVSRGNACWARIQIRTVSHEERLWPKLDMVWYDDTGAAFMRLKGLQLDGAENHSLPDRVIPDEQTNNLNQALVIEEELQTVGQLNPLEQHTEDSSRTEEPNAINKVQGRRLELRGMNLTECVQWELKELAGRTLKLKKDLIDPEENLAEFGFDSISLTEFASVLSRHYEIELTPAVFFGRSTLNELARYLEQEYTQVLNDKYGEAIEDQPVSETPARSKPTTGIKETGYRAAGSSRFAARTRRGLETSESIAIIGISGRFPEARDVDEMWSILVQGKDAVREVPGERFSRTGPVAWKCGLVPGVREFDPRFFEISPREAESMDPRQRLLLQESWRALEDASYGKKQLSSGKVGMFVGVENNEYLQFVGLNGPLTSNHNAVLAARLAYLLDLNGPNMAINTACSSGLAAVHQACTSLRGGECDTAIASGVSLLLTERGFEAMSQAGMLSEDGRCYAFDKRANGMVPGEAIAVVVLKRLSQAEADGDSIYGVIKGSGMNYDGKTNGITAPSGVAQTALMNDVYTRYGIQAERMEYIVTHGTGTRLGDPVEVNALQEAFKSRSMKQGYCALTSAKTNFGHTLAASGVVSLISLVQAMRHETIPASLHCEKESEYIRWSESPFYVNKTNQPWPKKGSPRLGAVSAFGISGTNVHLVVESYEGRRNEAVLERAPYYVLALSAKTEGALAQKVQDMIEALESGRAGQSSMAEISYTLLEGRQHFRHRCAIVVQSREDAVYVWKQAGGSEKPGNLFQGTVTREFTGQKMIQEHGNELLKQSLKEVEAPAKYRDILYVLADLYCQGYALDWEQMYGEPAPRRVNLPTYPFAKEEYWVTKEEVNGPIVTGEKAVTLLHPLVHRNTSDLNEQRYSSTFTGMETFLRGSKGLDSKQLPDAAHLEMARAAVQLAVQGAETDINVPVKMQLRDIKWVNPAVVAKEPLQVHIGLYPEEDGTLRYELFSRTETVGEEVVWSQGSAFLDAAAQKEEQPLNVAQIMERCRRIEPAAEQGHIQGHTQKSLHWPMEQYYLGAGEALVKLPRSDAALKPQGLVLDPQLLDAAIQAAADVTNGTPSRFHAAAETKTTASSKLVALESLDILSGGQAVWAWIRTREDTTELAESHAYEKTRKFDITLCDDAGQICFCIDGLQLREEEQQELGAQVAAAAEPNRTEATRLMTFEEVWEEANDALQVQTEVKTLVCLLSGRENQEALRTMLARRSPQTQVAFIAQPAPEQDGIHAAAGEACQTAFRCIRQEHEKVDVVLYLWPLEDPRCLREPGTIVQMLQAMAAEQVKPDRVLLAGEYTEGIERCYLDAWIGFERSLGLILPQTRLTVISRQAQAQPAGEAAWSLWPDLLWNELHTSQPQSVRYENGQRKVSLIRPVSPAAEPLPDSYGLKTGGTYLITGGLGGLGLVFARAWAPRGVNLILMGRSALDSAKQKTLEELEAAGSRSMYVQADVSEAAQVEEGLRGAKERFGAIHGLVHAAGVESRVSVLAKKAADFERVLSPKIQGTLVLEEALRAEPLAFRCYFSSSSALLGDFGSCDYAVANRFQMAYAQEQSREGSIRTVAINWPLWREGGMGAGEEEGSGMYLKTSGQRFLEKDEGVGLFEKIMREPHAQQLVMAGQPSRVHRFLGITAGPEPVKEAQQAPRKDKKPERRRPELRGKSLTECMQWELKELAGRTLKLKKDLIDPEENLAEFGFDSISLTEFASVLSRHYGIELTPAVFFGRSTLNELARYLEQEYTQVLNDKYGEAIEDQPVSETPARSKPTTGIKETGYRAAGSSRFAARTRRGLETSESIAIIGISGRFPEARDVDEMWSILVQGKDAVREVPGERFSRTGPVAWKCGLVPGVREFDPRFFEISPREAESMDPRQRLLLQESWRALEDASYGKKQLSSGKVGMFVGVENNEYLQFVGLNGPLTSNHNAVLAARLAYLLDLNGPNMAINTACSSGLAAVHQACTSLRGGECDTAIASGVSLLLTERGFEAMSQAGMLSEDGRCYAFDKRANGMVPGEAIAVVVLKRLSQAEADGDSIYGVIKGSGMNYDGKTNGITAPSGVAQTALMNDVYTRYGIQAERMEYIVTHGTGTRLGDPVEVNALQEAFKSRSMKQGYCALTSAKTNFGHTLAASGVVSLISLVQAMRHETIPASLHCEKESEYIRWSESPFYVNKTNQPWPKKGSPRLGAVSAFGISGTNVHLVVESYEGRRNEAVLERAPYYVLALSAKTEGALAQKVQDMIEALESGRAGQSSMAEISYTLLEGRQHFRHRCAIVVQSREDAVYVWKQAGGSEKPGNLFQGTVTREFTGQKMIQEHGNEMLKQSLKEVEAPAKYRDILYVLADLYCQGYALDWEQMYGEPAPRRVNLPTYPFAKEEYWVTKEEVNGPIVTGEKAVTLLHPLVHRNTSDFDEQRYSSTFSGQEFFLSDHVVQGKKLLPGVAHLEMARAALQLTMPRTDGISIHNVVWMIPIIVEKENEASEPVEVSIGLYPEEYGLIRYEIYSEEHQRNGGRVVYSQGQVSTSEVPNPIPVWDIMNLRASCNRYKLTAEDCYQAFRQTGLEYGQGHQGIQHMFVGDGKVLAQLKLPDSLQPEMHRYVLHPCLLDSALQAAIGMMLDRPNIEGALDKSRFTARPAVPFALQELKIYHPCSAEMWAWIRYSPDYSDEKKVLKLDIDLCNTEGTVCVRLLGFSSRPFDKETEESLSQGATDIMLLEPYWQEHPFEHAGAALKYRNHVVLLCGSHVHLLHELTDGVEGIQFISVSANENSAEVENWFQTSALQVFIELQSLFKAEPDGQLLVQIVVPEKGTQRLYAALTGMLQSARLEYPRFIGQLIEVEENTRASNMTEILLKNGCEPQNSWIRHVPNRRELASWRALEVQNKTEELVWRDGGVYLITGGAGKLGLLFAKEIALRVKRPMLTLIGRSPINEALQGALENLEQLGALVSYRQVDVTDERAVRELIEEMKKEYGTLNGIIHSAGVIRDSLFLNKTKEEWLEVMAPKVAGTVYLDRFTRGEDLDFFILFSSGTAVIGNSGQSDYATANAFMDVYASYRQAETALGNRKGRTLSINWPLWQDGGMRVEEATEIMMRQKLGIVPMKTEKGIGALIAALVSSKSQIMVMEGNVSLMKRAIEMEKAIVSSPEAQFPQEDVVKDPVYFNIVKRVLSGELTEEQFVEILLKESLYS
ncbi:SDR family NAD(P)-dependent oxidoreductase [Paenibacillus durus]|uniref:Carrier domain-containing protein n=1 Tax=Paenibacillus durus TaxID=44251 RepID=A0A089HP03_PAEDU|nr:SDR family NAD(P)-dependent oxidoreductase [Paenibacillus durus]AIQ12430.1 hypothetical protein PDUR_11300 [Paenibacillus durus]